MELDEDELEELVSDLMPSIQDWTQLYQLLLPELQAAAEEELPEGYQGIGSEYATNRVAEMIGMRVDSKTGSLSPNPNAEWNIAETTRQMLRDLILNTDADELPEAIEDFLGFSAERAEMIAETELSLIVEGSKYQAAVASGDQYWKRSVTGDGPCDDCVENEDEDWLDADDSFPSGDLYPPYHPHCQCTLEYTDQEPEAEKLALLKAGFDPEKHPRAPKGTAEGGEFISSEASLTASKQRAYTGRTATDVFKEWTKPYTGEVGEKIAKAYLIDQLGIKDLRDTAKHTHTSTNIPIDLVGDHQAFEIKAGLASSGTPRWRITLGEPGEKQKAYIKTLKPDQLREFNAAKKDAAVQRKLDFLKQISKETGMKIRPTTVGVIIHPDKGLADVHVWDGYHKEISWKSDFGKAGYVGSYKFKVK